MSLKNNSSSAAAAVALATIASSVVTDAVDGEPSEILEVGNEEAKAKLKKPKREAIPEVDPDTRRLWEVVEKAQVRSIVWRHFYVYKDQKFPGAVCKHCYLEKKDNSNYPPDSWEVRYGGATANTSHLERHFRTHHKDLYKKQCEELGIPETPLHGGGKRKRKEGDDIDANGNTILAEDSSVDEEDLPSAKKYKVKNPANVQVEDEELLDGEEAIEPKAPIVFDYQKAWGALDDKKCRYPKSIQIKALLTEMGVNEAEELAGLEKDQQLLLALVLKANPQKTFRQALHL